MKKINLIIVFLIALMMIFGITVNAETNESDSDYIMGKFYLEGFGVETDGLTYETPITRGFAANAITKALFGELSITDAVNPFADISADSPYAASAYMLNELKIMQGDGKNFNPENPITYNQAAKIFVSALGRDIEAQSKGGWPSGYMNVATKEGILDGVKNSSSEGLTFGDFAKMYYNFAQCKGFEWDGEKIGSYTESNNTVLQNMLYRNDMYYVEGVVTGNQYGSLISDDLGIISIENVSYDLGCDMPYDLIGYNVDAFVAKQNERYIVVSIIADATANETITLYEKDIVSTGISEIKYYENGKKRTLKLNDIMVVRNGKVLNSFTKKDLDPLNGGLVLLDNNKDGKYECVRVENRQYFTVSRISSDKNVLVLENFSYEGSTHLYVNPDDKMYYHRIYNSNGEPADFSDVKVDSVIRIEGSIDQNVLKIFIVDNIFDSKIEILDHDDIAALTIGGEEYLIANDTNRNPLIDVSEISFSTEYTFTVDNNLIIKMDEVKSDAMYAYVIDAERIGRSTYYLIVSEDKQIYEGELADKILYNGTRVDKSKFVPESGVVISYKVDSDGKICYIDDAEVYMPKANKIYKKSTNILYSQTYEYPVFMSEETVVFVVPDSGEEDDYMSDLTLADGKTYTCASYDYNDEDSSVSVVVVYEDVKYETPGYIYQDSPICILKDKKWTYNEEEDEFMCHLTWLEGTEEKSAFIKDTQHMNNLAEKMAEGDVFQYAITNRGFINNVNVLIMLDQNPEYFHNGAFTSVEQVFGKVISAETKVLPKGYVANFVNLFTLDVGDSSYKNFLVSDNAGDVSYYVFDTDTMEVKFASFDDVMTEDGVLGTFNASEVFIYYYGTSTTPPDAMAVVIKN